MKFRLEACRRLHDPRAHRLRPSQRPHSLTKEANPPRHFPNSLSSIPNNFRSSFHNSRAFLNNSSFRKEFRVSSRCRADR